MWHSIVWSNDWLVTLLPTALMKANVLTLDSKKEVSFSASQDVLHFMRSWFPALTLSKFTVLRLPVSVMMFRIWHMSAHYLLNLTTVWSSIFINLGSQTSATLGNSGFHFLSDNIIQNPYHTIRNVLTSLMYQNKEFETFIRK